MEHGTNYTVQSVSKLNFNINLKKAVMDWRPVQGVPILSPDDRWDRLQPHRDPTDGLSGYRKWMDLKKAYRYEAFWVFARTIEN